MKILGVRVLGQHASSVIEIVALMIRLDRPLKDLADSYWFLFHLNIVHIL
jgi:hypothetical protein